MCPYLIVLYLYGKETIGCFYLQELEEKIKFYSFAKKRMKRLIKCLLAAQHLVGDARPTPAPPLQPSWHGCRGSSFLPAQYTCKLLIGLPRQTLV